MPSRDHPLPAVFRDLIGAQRREREELRRYPEEELCAIIREVGFSCDLCGRCCTRAFNGHVLLLDSDVEKIRESLRGADMVFLTAGLGGGTGTGGAPVIAEVAREMGAITVAIVTKPFHFEGKKRMKQAEEGLANLRMTADALITIPNQRLLSISGKNMTLLEAATIALGYVGDSILNSVSDIGLAALGFLFAWRARPWVTVFVIALMEGGTLLLMRDNLALNIVMLIHPIDAIKTWQMAGRPLP